MMEAIKKIPVLGSVLRSLYWRLPERFRARHGFRGSSTYWENRYASGGNSGAGSYSFFAEFKAQVINEFVASHEVASIIELGCGDGNQLLLADYPRYLGFDVSASAIARCRDLFGQDGSKTFLMMQDLQGHKADLVLSLDVIYHLVEDPVFERYMNDLFGASTRYVMIYSSNMDAPPPAADDQHVRHRTFTNWVRRNAPQWRQVGHVPNRYPYNGDHRTGSFADFFVFQKA